MSIDTELLAVLACPSDDHAALREEKRAGADVLVCSFCASSFHIRDGIAVLLLDDATPGPNGLGNAAG
ncbi:MAG: tetraacyldisaccharide 4'-kinase [Pseudonocardiales bacterium]|nr:MAG: tetraacyldisaccharide 4'-kinase [Pseudonocardiales bacterium]